MKGFIGLTTKEKEDILKQHVKPYDGYAVGNVNTNMYPLTVYDAARDKGGITVDNHGNPGVYRNHNINEIAAKNLHYDAIEEPYEFDSQGPGDPNLGYDVYNDTLPSYDFDSKGPEQFEDDDVYSLDDKNDMSLDLSADGEEMYPEEKPAYEFDSPGPYGSTNTFEGVENPEKVKDSIKESLNWFKRFSNFN
jgi:hypothetical protein